MHCGINLKVNDFRRVLGRYAAAPGTEEIIKRLARTLLLTQIPLQSTSSISRVEHVAKKKNLTMAQVAVAWSLSKEGEALRDSLNTGLYSWCDIRRDSSYCGDYQSP